MMQELILVATITMVLLTLMVIALFSIFQTKKNRYINEKIVTEKKMAEEMTKSKIEIKEQSLKNIAWELHDNIGQLLSTAKLQLNILESSETPASRAQISEISGLIGDSLKEIRVLSKTLNPDVIQNIGLARSIQLEIDRFNRMNFVEAHFHCSGEEASIAHRDEIILFRIIQEFLSNVIKHSKASRLQVHLLYSPNRLTIEANDDGIGFDAEQIEHGSGLINMKSRAEMIGANYNLKAKKGKGVFLELIYPLI